MGNIFFLDHQLCSRGKAYTNHTSDFYPVEGGYQNYFSYGAPFQQFVFDDSVGFVSGEKQRKPQTNSEEHLWAQLLYRLPFYTCFLQTL